MPMHQPLRLRHHVPRRRLLLQPRQATGAQGQGGPKEGGIQPIKEDDTETDARLLRGHGAGHKN
jgi:hypothetical protein